MTGAAERRSSEAGRGGGVFRRSKALLGRRANFSDDRGRTVTRILGRATTVSAGYETRLADFVA